MLVTLAGRQHPLKQRHEVAFPGVSPRELTLHAVVRLFYRTSIILFTKEARK